MIYVYHTSSRMSDRDRADAMCFSDAPQRLWADPANYVAVAEVDSDDLETAWVLTNSVEEYWGDSKDPRVKALPPQEDRAGHRSSCVGDVFLDGDGRAWRVATMGFEPLEATADEERECV